MVTVARYAMLVLSTRYWIAKPSPAQAGEVADLPTGDDKPERAAWPVAGEVDLRGAACPGIGRGRGPIGRPFPVAPLASAAC
jgi:hypothetical protein